MNNMKTSDALPTTFAKSLGELNGILIKHERGMDHHDYNKRIKLMQAFQQMSVLCSFEDSLIAFHGFDLSKDQMEALEIIYKNTKPWMLGYVITVALEKLESETVSKNYSEPLKYFIEKLTE